MTWRAKETEARVISIRPALGVIPPFDQAAAQFHASGSAPLRRERGSDRIDADFDHDFGMITGHATSANIQVWGGWAARDINQAIRLWKPRSDWARI